MVRDGLDSRKSIVVGVAFWLGVGFQNRQIFSDHLGDAVASILENGIAAGGLAAIVMAIALEMSKPRRRKIKTKLGVESLPETDEFVRRFAKQKRWNATSTERLRAATEEAILSLVPGRDGLGAGRRAEPGSVVGRGCPESGVGVHRRGRGG